MRDRRAFWRVDCGVEVALEYAGESFPSKIVNISLGGVLVNTAASPMKGDDVTVSFELRTAYDPIRVRCQGQVIRAEGRGVGIQFEDLDDRSLADLKQMMLEHTEDPAAVEADYAKLTGLKAGKS